MHVRGTLRKAQRVSIPSGGFSLRGTIHGDTKQQYRDGWFIYTAKVMEEIEPDVFRTADRQHLSGRSLGAAIKDVVRIQPNPGRLAVLHFPTERRAALE